MTAAQIPDADVLDREEPQTAPQAQTQEAKDIASDASFEEEKLGLPGIMKARPEDLEADEATTSDGGYDPDFLSLDELLEQIKAKKPDIQESEVAKIRTFFETAHEHSGGKLAIPRVAENVPQDNADLALELYNATSLDPRKSGIRRTMETVFTNTAGNGYAKVRDGGVFFHAAKEEGSWFKKKPFTEADARQIALLAMHNKDMLPPNAIKITGNKEQRAMIKAEIDKLNELLPEKTQFKLTAKQMKEFAAAPVAAAPAQPETAAPVNNDHELFEAVLRNDPDAGKHPVVGKADVDGVDTPVHETGFSHNNGVVKVHYIDKGDDFKVLAFETDDNFGSYLKAEEPPKSEANASFSGAAAPLTQSHPDFIGPREFVGPRQPAAAPTPPTV